MSIRQAVREDVPQIADLVRSLAHYYLDSPDAVLPSWLNDTLTDDAFLMRITSREYSNFVFDVADSVVGYIAIKEPGHLYHLFVSERFQGNGISRQLWEHVKENSGSTVFTVRSSLYAVPVYKRFGFSESGPAGIKDGVSFQPMELII